MPTNIDLKTKEILDLSGGVQRQTSSLYRKENEWKKLINASTERLGGIEKAKGCAKLGNSVSTGTVLGLVGFSTSGGTDKLVAILGTDAYIYNTGTSNWDAQSQSFTASQSYDYDVFMNLLFVVNGTDSNRNYSGSAWSTSTMLTDAPKASLIRRVQNKLYLGSVTILSTTYKSRVWHCDFPKNSTLAWGIETGTDLAQTATSAVVTSATATFKTSGIKVGDPFTITTGTNAGEYIVQSIDSNTQITLTQTLTYTQSGNTYWVGGNYIDFETDNGDILIALGENSDELLAFKRDSLTRYNPRADAQYKVKNAKGTTSRKSVLNLGSDTFYFHPFTGINRYRSGSVEIISEPIRDIIEGITSANYDDVVAWSEKERYACFYVGDVTTREGDTISNCIIVYDTYTERWTFKSWSYAITASTIWYQSGVPAVYIADNNGQVLTANSGYGYNTTSLPFIAESHPLYAVNTDTTVDLIKIRLTMEKISELGLSYRLIHKPTGTPGIWTNDINWTPLKGTGRGNKVEYLFPIEKDIRASAIELSISESSTNPVPLIEKITLFYANPKHDY